LRGVGGPRRYRFRCRGFRDDEGCGLGETLFFISFYTQVVMMLKAKRRRQLRIHNTAGASTGYLCYPSIK
jgi:hypothetical protein